MSSPSINFWTQVKIIPSMTWWPNLNLNLCLFTKNDSQKDNLFQYHRNMVICPSLNPKTKDNFVYTLRSALLVPLYFHFAGSRAGLLKPIILYVYIYIFRWWLDTAGSVLPKGRLRLDGVCCDWAFALLCYDVGSVTTGTPAHHPTLWLCVGDVGLWTSGVCCGMARDWRSPSFRSVAIHLIY